MNGVAIGAYEPILCGFEATPRIYYFKLFEIKRDLFSRFKLFSSDVPMCLGLEIQYSWARDGNLVSSGDISLVPVRT